VSKFPRRESVTSLSRSFVFLSDFLCALCLSCFFYDTSTTRPRPRSQNIPVTHYGQAAYNYDDGGLSYFLSLRCISCLRRSVCNRCRPSSAENNPRQTTVQVLFFPVLFVRLPHHSYSRNPVPGAIRRNGNPPPAWTAGDTCVKFAFLLKRLLCPHLH